MLNTACARFWISHAPFPVIGCDIDKTKLDLIRARKSPILEEGIQELMRDVVASGRAVVTDDAVSAIADSAAGYAALTLMATGVGVLTTEFKINFLAPAAGDRIVARARVIKAGRTLTVAQSEVYAEQAGQEKLIALLTATLMAIEGRDGIAD